MEAEGQEFAKFLRSNSERSERFFRFKNMQEKLENYQTVIQSTAATKKDKVHVQQNLISSLLLN